MTPGIYHDISNEDYHAGDGVSKSQLDMVAKNPALLKWVKAAPEDEEKNLRWILVPPCTACCWSRKNSKSVSSWRRNSTAGPIRGKPTKKRS